MRKKSSQPRKYSRVYRRESIAKTLKEQGRLEKLRSSSCTGLSMMPGEDILSSGSARSANMNRLSE